MMNAATLTFVVISWHFVDISCQPISPFADVKESFVEAANEFAIRVYKRLASEDGNIFFCPLCLSSSLALLLETSRGKTQSELNETLAMKENKLTLGDVGRGFAQLNERLVSMDCLPPTANGWFVDDSFAPLFDISRQVTTYNTEVLGVDFAENPQQAAWDVNDFAKTLTGGLVKRVLDRVDAVDQLLLLNAVHFGIGLEKPGGDSKSTRVKRRFFNHGVEDHDLDVPAFAKNQQRVRVADSYDFRALELSCSSANASNVSLWIFLPHKVGHLADVEYGLSTDTFRQVGTSFKEVVTDICIPRIKFDYFKDLSTELQRLGLKRVFDPDGADLGGMTEAKGFHLSKVLHRASVDIGAQGFSYWSSQVDGELPSLQTTTKTTDTDGNVTENLPLPPFKADHPFLFCVVDKTSGIIIHMGRLFEF